MSVRTLLYQAELPSGLPGETGFEPATYGSHSEVTVIYATRASYIIREQAVTDLWHCKRSNRHLHHG